MSKNYHIFFSNRGVPTANYSGKNIQKETEYEKFRLTPTNVDIADLRMLGKRSDALFLTKSFQKVIVF